MHSGWGTQGNDRVGVYDPIRAVRDSVDTLTAHLDVDAMTDAEIGTDLVRVHKLIDRLQALAAELTTKAHQRGVGTEDGHASTAAWIRWKTGQTLTDVHRARQHGELAALLPATGAAWREGRITTHAVDLITRARVPGHDEQLAPCEPQFLDLATRYDHRSLRLATEHFAKCARADGNQPLADDGVSLAMVGDRTVITGELHGAAAETVAHTIGAFTAKPSPTSDTTPAQRRAEALVRICEVALRHGTDAEGARPSVGYVIHARTADGPGLAEGNFGGVLDPRERERILCDASVSRIVIGPDDLPLNVGRASPAWPAAIRRAIAVRDRHCRWPGCELPAPWTDVHHVEAWEHGGETSVTNGVLLCRRHHTFLHTHPDWTFTFDDQQLRVVRPDGRELFREPVDRGRELVLV